MDDGIRTVSRRRLLAGGAALLLPTFGGCTEETTTERPSTAVEATPTAAETARRLTLSPDVTPTEVTYGDPLEGSIDQDSGIAPVTGRPGDPVQFHGEAGTVVRVSLESEALEARVIFSTPDGSIWADVDDGDQFARRFLHSSGTHNGWVTTEEGPKTGSYTLSVERARFDRDLDPNSIENGETVSGYLTPDDGTVPYDGSVGEPVEFDGEAGDTVSLRLESYFIRPTLAISGPDGDLVAENLPDDGEWATYEDLETTLDSTGTHTAWILFNKEEGPYSLSFTNAGKYDSQRDLRQIAYGETRRGHIAESDPRGPVDGKRAEPVTFHGSVGDIVRFEGDGMFQIEESSVIAQLGLVEPGGKRPIGGRRNPLEVILEADGEHTLWVSAMGGRTGPYELTATKVGELDRDEIFGGSRDLRWIEYGETKRGYVDHQDPQYIVGVPSEPVGFSGQAGDEIILEAESDHLKPYLRLSEGTKEERSASPGSFALEMVSESESHLRIRATLGTDGRHTIWVASQDGPMNGPYTLTATAGE